MTTRRPEVGDVVQVNGQEAVVVKTGFSATKAKTDVWETNPDETDLYLGTELQDPNKRAANPFAPWKLGPDAFVVWGRTHKPVWASVVGMSVSAFPWAHPKDWKIAHNDSKLFVQIPVFPGHSVELHSSLDNDWISGELVFHENTGGRRSAHVEQGKNTDADAMGVVWSLLDAAKDVVRDNPTLWPQPQTLGRNLTFVDARRGEQINVLAGTHVLRIMGPVGFEGPPLGSPSFHAESGPTGLDGAPTSGWFHLSWPAWGSDKRHFGLFVADPSRTASPELPE